MPKAKRATARVGFGRLEFAGGKQPLFVEDALSESIVPGTEVERYGRLWRMARNRREGSFMIGRIGFETGGSQVSLWDKKMKDFVEAHVAAGHTSLFVLDVKTLRIAYELRSGFIKPGTFTGNFQALLNEEAPHWKWVVTDELVEPWPAFNARVERVTQLTITVRRPNPRFRSEQIREVIEGAKAKSFQIGLRADPGQGLNTEDEFIKGAIDQAEYSGTISATGEVTVGGRTKKEFWKGRKQGAPVEKTVPADPQTREADPTAMKKELTQPAAEAGEPQ